ncbi:unnamed protein product [Caenorhabditis brenneri]
MQFSVLLFLVVAVSVAVAQFEYNQNYDALGRSFMKVYYSKFDNPNGEIRSKSLTRLYDPNCTFLLYKGQVFNTREEILAKFKHLGFQSIQRTIKSMDLTSLPDGSILIKVLGQIQTDIEPIYSFSHVLTIRPSETGSFTIINEDFRVVKP